MNARLLLIPLIALLAACQSPRQQLDYDQSRDFSVYRSWSWQEPPLRYQPDDARLVSDLTEQRIREAVAEQLDQRGLRPAGETADADLRVQAWMILDDRQHQIVTHYGSGFAWGHPWRGGYMAAPVYAESRSIDYQVGTLQIDLIDTRDNRLVWRGSSSQVVSSRTLSPSDRAGEVRELVRQVLSQYPPR
ncbi:DUF4136 domain-containing protein [Stutzerimonas tarimensis]|uniref:DUF4136 domain-containing protein n=1 Tax=Stutzerimonas tarimensis TaxID=1507735 RepID=A0ABV7T8J8_9GAMM